MWKVYLLLRPSVEHRESETMVLDEAFKIIDLASPQALLEVVNIIYDNKVVFTTPMEFNNLFINGLLGCGFFEFCTIIRGLNGVHKQ